MPWESVSLAAPEILDRQDAQVQPGSLESLVQRERLELLERDRLAQLEALDPLDLPARQEQRDQPDAPDLQDSLAPPDLDQRGTPVPRVQLVHSEQVQLVQLVQLQQAPLEPQDQPVSLALLVPHPQPVQRDLQATLAQRDQLQPVRLVALDKLEQRVQQVEPDLLGSLELLESPVRPVRLVPPEPLVAPERLVQQVPRVPQERLEQPEQRVQQEEQDPPGPRAPLASERPVRPDSLEQRVQ